MTKPEEPNSLELAGLVLAELDAIAEPRGTTAWQNKALHLISVHLNAVTILHRNAHTELMIRCGMCICGDGPLDECCPVCVPAENRGDVFQQRDAAVAFARKVEKVADSSAFKSVFSIASIHHAEYRGETWDAERRELERALGEPLLKPEEKA